MKTNLPHNRNILLLIAVLLVTACAGNNQAKNLDLTLIQYEKLVRWSEWDLAVEFLAPEYLQTNPVTPLDIERLRLFRVTQYSVRSSVPLDGGVGLRQTVEIRMFNRNRGVERVITDRQEWRYNPDNQRWLLHSGLPDVTRAR